MEKAKIVGQKLREKRRRLGLTLKAVGELAEVSENRISELERGTEKIPSDSLLYKVAEIYRVDELELFNAYGKIPKGLVGIVNELERNEDFKETVRGIQESNLSDKEKDNLYKEIRRLYLATLNKCTRGE